MLVYFLLLTSLLIVFAAIKLVYIAAKHSAGKGWHLWLLSLALLSFAYLYGTWVYLSVYVKYVLPMIYLVAAFCGRHSSSHPPKIGKRLPNVVLSSVLFTLCVLYFSGTTRVAKAVELQFPLKRGEYFVFQGGKGLPTNLFHYSYRGAVYAIDLVRLNKYGNRASKIFSKVLEDYYIFNDTVYSPCNGLIETMHDNNPDNIPPNRERGPTNTNMLVIDAGAYFVFMGHLKYKGVFVNEGDRVTVGQPIALVGNSGFSIEPHLHIQAHAKPETGNGWYKGEPLLIQFDGRSYLLFERITPKKVPMKNS